MIGWDDAALKLAKPLVEQAAKAWLRRRQGAIQRTSTLAELPPN